jgi:hypothetical protein
VIEVSISFLIKALWIGILLSLVLFGGCTKKKTVAPTEPAFYLMKDYFPLNEGDQWTWEVAGDTVTEPFLDGDVNLGEPFVDSNNNGVYDFGEQYDDLNLNGKCDGPNDPWTPGIPYIDRNGDGDYDPPNGKWDEGEPFIDLDSNGIQGWPQHYTAWLQAGIGGSISVSSDGSVIFGRRSHFVGSGGDFVVRYTDDGFSNDSLGLRWHSHNDVWGFSQQDDLKDHTPITIAWATTQVGDTVVNADTSYVSGHVAGIYNWISIFELVENVTTPAGTFEKCLRFKSMAWGWIGNMYRYNGISYQWYAKNVGLVKSEGPQQGEYWILKSAKINGKDYP